MLPGWLAILLFLTYMAMLFLLARWGERAAPRLQATPGPRKAIYVLSACVFTSSWSYFGAIGLASREGFAYLPVFIGPMLAFGLLFPLIRRMVRLTKAQNITSLADFVAARYGRSGAVAATVTAIAALAYIPYMALQLRAVAQSMTIFIDGRLPAAGELGETATILTILATIVLAAFSIAIGARRLDVTEHLRGLMLVIAAETIFKLVAILGIGAYVTWGLFGGLGALMARAQASAATAAAIKMPLDVPHAISMIVLTTAIALFIPRQFHVTVVENRHEADVRTTAWFVPLYLVATNLFVIPIAAAGLLTFPIEGLDRDFTVLALPIHAGSPLMTTIAMIGGFSAATSMIFISATVLATMIGNNLILPVVLRARGRRALEDRRPSGAPVLAIRRLAMVALFVVSSLFALHHGTLPFSTVGLIAFVGLVQIVPAAGGGMIWRRATGRGAVGGSIAGIVVTFYTLLLPALLPHGASIVVNGPFGIKALRPTDLFGFDIAPLQQALMWSLTINIACYVILSLSRPATIIERIQAGVFVLGKAPGTATSSYARHFGLSTRDLLAGVATYVGPTTEAQFRAHQASDGIAFDLAQEADASLTAFAENLLASTIGTASAYLVIALLKRREVSREAALRIANDLAFEIQDGRDVLQHAIDVARDGMAVFDSDLRLVAWNRTYRDMFEIPVSLMRVGVTLERLIRSNAERGLYGEGPVEHFIAARFDALARATNGTRLRSSPFGRVLETRTIRLHNGGVFLTYTDATERAETEEELETENELLERRVNERTEELQHLNFELARAKAEADDANISKTRFLAAASHDLLQPLNAARLYTTSLRERLRDRANEDNAGIAGIAANVDASLESVEEILGALLEISQLDAGATDKEISEFAIGDILRQLQMEFGPVAFEHGLRLTVMPSTRHVRSDRRLLRRLLQNLISNAIKYTKEGRVLIGVRRVGAAIRIDVADTGMGIPGSQQQTIFREFTRLPAAVKAASGVGLGLSIVERLGRVLEHELRLNSQAGRGSMFSVIVPAATMPPQATAWLQGTVATSGRQRSLNGLRVAAIDDEAHVLAGMDILLRGWDCVVATGTGLLAIEAALDEFGMKPDVVIADFHIGDTDGIAVIKALRQRHGPCPAVLITADRGPIVKARAFTEDVRVLYKPVKPAALRSLLSQWRLVKSSVE